MWIARRRVLVAVAAITGLVLGAAHADHGSFTYHCSYDGKWITKVVSYPRDGASVYLYRFDKDATRSWHETIYGEYRDQAYLSVEGSESPVEGVVFLEDGAYLMLVYGNPETGHGEDPVISVINTATGQKRTVRRRELHQFLSRRAAWIPRMRDGTRDLEKKEPRLWFERRRPFVVDETTHQVFMVARVSDDVHRAARAAPREESSERADCIAVVDYRKGTVEAVEGGSWMSILVDLQGYGPRIDPVRTDEVFGFKPKQDVGLLSDPLPPAVVRFRQVMPGISPQAPSKATGPWVQYLQAPRSGPVEVLGWMSNEVVLLMPKQNRGWKVVAMIDDGSTLRETASIGLPHRPERCLLDSECRYLVTLDSNMSIGAGRRTIGIHDLRKSKSRYFMLDDFLTVQQVSRLLVEEYAPTNVRLWRHPDNHNLILRDADFSTVWNDYRPPPRNGMPWSRLNAPVIKINVIEGRIRVLGIR